MSVRISKRYSAQHYLLVMTEKFHKSVDNGNEFGTHLTDLSKELDCIDHSLLLTKYLLV